MDRHAPLVRELSGAARFVLYLRVLLVQFFPCVLGKPANFRCFSACFGPRGRQEYRARMRDKAGLFEIRSRAMLGLLRLVTYPRD